MIIFLVIILIVVVLASFVAIAFIVRENKRQMTEIVDMVSQTYLDKFERELESKTPNEVDAPDPSEWEELTPEEEMALRLNPPKIEGETKE